ncbi:hypothetical protein AB0D04_31465 [Streptomyces sp. NPDC048483]|uniref:hypothetical protein n=1 Tax=Streptomyces sp. NPDC048483 TaxID=3154927 RepID=UPI003427492C
MALRQADPGKANSGRVSLATSPGLADLERLAAATADAGVRVDVRRSGDQRPLPADIDLSAYRIGRPSTEVVDDGSGAVGRAWPTASVSSACGSGSALTAGTAAPRPGAGFVDGHIAAAEGVVDVDFISHVLERGTHRALVVAHPRSGMLQGAEPSRAEPHLRWLAGHKHTLPDAAATLREVIQERDDA